jgi:hypothetical protein
MYKPFVNPEAETQTKFTADLAGLIAWLETMPGETRYNWYDNRACLLCRFAKANGCDPETGYCGVLNYLNLPGHICSEIERVAAYGQPTYAAALLRAKAALSRARATAAKPEGRSGKVGL